MNNSCGSRSGDNMDYRESHLGKSHNYDETLKMGGLDTYMLERENEILNHILPELVDKHKLQRYLDFACGTGRITSIFEKYIPESMGVDISENMVSVAKEKCTKTTFTIKDITSEELEAEPFDVISSFRFFGNAQDELRMAVLKKMNLLLKQGGLLVVNNHRNPSSILCRLSNLTGGKDDADLSCSKFNGLLEDSGFEVIRKITIGAWLVRYKWIRERIYNSALGKILDKIFNLPLLACLSPDMIIIARKKHSKKNSP